MNTYYYDGARAAAYAQKWAFGRNPDYYNFDNIGGDCTNFASQCIFAGCGVMNYSPLFGWFYRERTITRAEGAVLILCYIAYITYLYLNLPD